MEECKILFVDDDKKAVSAIKEYFQEKDYVVIEASSGEEAIDKISTYTGINVAIIDHIMPGMDGLSLLDNIKEINPELYVIIAGEDGNVPTVVNAITRGASDFITKPYDHVLLLKKLNLIRKANALETKVSLLSAELQNKSSFHNILSCSRLMKKVLAKASLAAKTDAHVFLVGETGTGKGLLARAIHENSHRRNGRFVSVNCGAIPKELIEAELFGYKKGAFTGAISSHDGIFVAANKGTVFLDEIGEMSKEHQIRLLTVLEDSKVRPIGQTDETPIDVRVLAASNRSIQELKDIFLREDLYYRLAVIIIEVPPLRERKEDIPLLLEHFKNIFNLKYSRNVEEISNEALDALYEYHFPGNIRELENMIEGIIAVSTTKKNKITFRDLKANAAFHNGNTLKLGLNTINEVEKTLIRQAINKSKGNKSMAAEILGVSRNTLYRKLKQYDLE